MRLMERNPYFGREEVTELENVTNKIHIVEKCGQSASR